MDEVSQIYSISERKLDFLERLKKDCVNIDEKNELEKDTITPDFSKPFAAPHIRELMINRIDDAMRHIRENHEGLPGVLNDLRNSLDDVRPSHSSDACPELMFP